MPDSDRPDRPSSPPAAEPLPRDTLFVYGEGEAGDYGVWHRAWIERYETGAAAR